VSLVRSPLQSRTHHLLLQPVASSCSRGQVRAEQLARAHQETIACPATTGPPVRSSRLGASWATRPRSWVTSWRASPSKLVIRRAVVRSAMVVAKSSALCCPEPRSAAQARTNAPQGRCRSRSRMRAERPVLPAARIPVTAQLPAHRRLAAPQLCRNGPHPEPGTQQVRDGDPVILGQEPLRDHLLPRADHGCILQPRTAAAGHGTPEPPAFPGLRMHADDPARLRAANTPGDQTTELLPLRRRSLETAVPV
jgi:hypothetical protein